jgi:PAS domain S-box-containing protein
MIKGSIWFKLFVVILFVGISAIGPIGIWGYANGKKALTVEALSHLLSVRDIKKRQIENYFHKKLIDTEIIANSLVVTRYFLEAANMAESTGKPPQSIIEALEKQSHKTSSGMGFYDIFLINRTGDILFTIAKEDDLGTNLVSGKYKDTYLAKLFHEALIEQSVSDIDFYEPSEGKISGFFASPVKDNNGSVIGVLATQVTVDDINEIMQERSGLGMTGETFLIGADLVLRSNSRLSEESSVLKHKVDWQVSRRAVEGETGALWEQDSNNKKVLAAFAPIYVHGLTWGLVAKMDEDEFLAPIYQFWTQVLIRAVLLGVVIILISYFFAKKLTAPIKRLSDKLLEIAESGNYDQRLPVTSSDEVGDLVTSFNNMTQKLFVQTGELKKLSQAVEQSPAVVVITDKEGTIEYVNPQFTEVTGYIFEEAIGQNPRILKSGKNPPSLYKELWENISAGKVWKGEMINKIKSGEEIWEFVSISPIFSDTNEITHFVAVKEDITERKRMEHEIVEAKEKAEEATRAKSDFLANMSHEIRTPMNGIMGMTELLLDTELTQEQREYLNTIDFSAESLLTLIDGILDFSKIEANKLELDPIDFDLRERLGETLDTLAVRAHGKGLELAFDIDEDVPQMLVGDVNRIRQITMNLVGNALKFTDSGEVVVNVTVESREKSDVLLHFSVSDTGIGIPVERLNSIFNSFEQADTSTTRKYGGTGLGLTICSRLIELMGGRIWVKSTPGTGTVFHFTTAMQVSTQTRRDVNLEALGALGKLRVLVVDDNKTNRRILEKMLSNWHMDSTLAEAAHQGLDTLHNAFEARQPFDLIISDVNMPEMDGFDFIERIKSMPELATIPIILLTSANRSGDMQRCYDLGAQAHLVKPVRQSKMLDVIMTSIGVETVIRKHDAQHSDKDSESVTTGPLSILLAEDNEVNQKFALRVLDKAGHITTVVNNGREAVDAMGDNKFDVILMDVQMPEMDGYEATAEIRRLEQQAGTHIPIIALTAHAMKGDREKCLEAGMDGYITKPIKSKTLLAKITNVMSA